MKSCTVLSWPTGCCITLYIISTDSPPWNFNDAMCVIPPGWTPLLIVIMPTRVPVHRVLISVGEDGVHQQKIIFLITLHVRLDNHRFVAVCFWVLYECGRKAKQHFDRNNPVIFICMHSGSEEFWSCCSNWMLLKRTSNFHYICYFTFMFIRAFSKRCFHVTK